MQCPSCGHENREGRKFCSECGSLFSTELRCADCGAVNEEDEKFCGECGAAFSATSPQPSPAPPSPPAAHPTAFFSGRYQVGGGAIGRKTGPLSSSGERGLFAGSGDEAHDVVAYCAGGSVCGGK